MAAIIDCESNMRLQHLIDEYPEELLLKIFGFLGSTTIINLTLVNKRWHDIVTNDISTMRKLPLIICDDMLRMEHFFVGKLSYKLYKVIFKSADMYYNTVMLSSLKSIGSNIREIEFTKCYICEPKDFQNILRNFPKVEKLMFNRCTFKFLYTKLNDTKVLQLENLNELVLNEQNLTIFCFIGAQLKSLKVKMPYFDEKLENKEELRQFLYTQKRLETLELTIKTATSEVFAQIANAVIQFKLKKLSLRFIENKRRFKGLNDENLKDFLNTQKDSVEILELGSVFSNNVIELILNKFENLKTLSICVYNYPANLKRIKINKNVTKLSLDGVNRNTVQYCAFLSLFPNVTDISFSSLVPFEVLSWLSKYCNALTSLSLSNLSCENYENVKFPALKNLHLGLFIDESKWTDFVMYNPTIESLSIRSIFVKCNFDADKLKMLRELLPNLKHLTYEGLHKYELYNF